MSTPRVGCKYVFVPVLMDRGLFPENAVVTVVPIPGMSGRMPSMFRHVEYEGRVAMVCSGSLIPVAKHKEVFAAIRRVEKAFARDAARNRAPKCDDCKGRHFEFTPCDTEVK